MPLNTTEITDKGLPLIPDTSQISSDKETPGWIRFENQRNEAGPNENFRVRKTRLILGLLTLPKSSKALDTTMSTPQKGSRKHELWSKEGHPLRCGSKDQRDGYRPAAWQPPDPQQS